MYLPPKRKRPRSGIEREPRRVWHQHRRWVRSHGCVVPGCKDDWIEFAHVRSAANSGTGLKPHDCYGVALCAEHHYQQHTIGQPAFERLYGIDLGRLAEEFTRRSPDTEMRAYMREEKK
jgi:hypothetical protein